MQVGVVAAPDRHLTGTGAAASFFSASLILFSPQVMPSDRAERIARSNGSMDPHHVGGVSAALRLGAFALNSEGFEEWARALAARIEMPGRDMNGSGLLDHVVAGQPDSFVRLPGHSLQVSAVGRLPSGSTLCINSSF
jgi:hypothetical protein